MKANELFEITHDSLAAKIWEKVSAEEQDLIEAKNILVSEYKNYQSRGNLLSRKDLAFIAHYENKLNLDAEMKKFVRRSKNNYLKRRMVLFALYVVILLLAAGFIIYLQSANRKQQLMNIELGISNQKFDRANNELKGAINVAGKLRNDADSKAASLQTLSDKLKRNNQSLYHANTLLHEKINEVNHFSQEANASEARAKASAAETKNLSNQTTATLDAIKLFQENPTASLWQSLLIYDSITMPGLRSTLKRNVYRAFEEIIYEQELKFKDPVTDIAVHPDMKYVVIADHTSNPKLWDLRSRSVRSLMGHQGPVTALAIAPDGSSFLSVESNRGVIFWDEHGNYKGYKAFDDDIADIKFLNRSGNLLIGYKNGALLITDEQGNIKERMDKTLLDIRQLLVLKNCRPFDFVTLSSDDKVRFWYRDKQKRYSLTEFPLPVMNMGKIVSVSLSPNNKVLAIGADDGFYLFPFQKEKLDTPRSVTSRSIPLISNIAFRDDENLVVATATGQCFNFNLVSKQTREAQGHLPDKRINCIATPSNNKYFITAGDDGTVKIWNASQGRIYSFRTRQFSLSGKYDLLNKDGRLKGYQDTQMENGAFDFAPPDIPGRVYTFPVVEKVKDDFKEKGFAAGNDTLKIIPVYKSRRGLEMITGIQLKDASNTVKTISAKNGMIYMAAFSGDGELIIVQSNDMDFSNVSFDIYPTFSWMVNHFKRNFQIRVYEGN